LLSLKNFKSPKLTYFPKILNVVGKAYIAAKYTLFFIKTTKNGNFCRLMGHFFLDKLILARSKKKLNALFLIRKKNLLHKYMILLIFLLF